MFLIVDDLRPQLGCYGRSGMVTPSIDALAQRSALFGRHFCQQAICGPSRNHIFTGCRPDTTRVYDLQTRLSDRSPHLVTMPQHLKKHGYTTLTVGKVFHNPDDDPTGFTRLLRPAKSEQAGRGYLTAEAIQHAETNTRALRDRGSTKHGMGPAFEVGPDDRPYQDELNVTAAVDALKTVGEEPFFLTVGFTRPHLPFCAPRSYWELYDPDVIEVPSVEPPRGCTPYSLTNWGELRDYYGIPREGPMPHDVARTLIHGYYACVSYLDAQIGRVLAALDQSGARDNTIVVMCADHGMKLGEFGCWSKHTVFEADNHVPLLISVPGRDAVVTNRMTENVDIFPTICALCGIDAPPQIQGVDLSPLLDDPLAPWQDVALMQYPRADVMAYAVRTPRFLYCEWRRRDTSVAVARELYDLDRDGEHENVIDRAAYADEIPTLAALLPEPRPTAG